MNSLPTVALLFVSFGFVLPSSWNFKKLLKKNDKKPSNQRTRVQKSPGPLQDPKVGLSKDNGNILFKNEVRNYLEIEKNLLQEIEKELSQKTKSPIERTFLPNFKFAEIANYFLATEGPCGRYSPIFLNNLKQYFEYAQKIETYLIKAPMIGENDWKKLRNGLEEFLPIFNSIYETIVLYESLYNSLGKSKNKKAYSGPLSYEAISNFIGKGLDKETLSLLKSTLLKYKEFLDVLPKTPRDLNKFLFADMASRHSKITAKICRCEERGLLLDLIDPIKMPIDLGGIFVEGKFPDVYSLNRVYDKLKRNMDRQAGIFFETLFNYANARNDYSIMKKEKSMEKAKDLEFAILLKNKYNNKLFILEDELMMELDYLNKEKGTNFFTLNLEDNLSTLELSGQLFSCQNHLDFNDSSSPQYLLGVSLKIVPPESFPKMLAVSGRNYAIHETPLFQYSIGR